MTAISPTFQLLCRLKFSIQLGDEALRGLGRIRDFGVIFGGRFGGQHLILGFTQADQLRHAVPNRQDHVAMRDYGITIDGGAMAGDDFRIGTRVPDDFTQPVGSGSV